MLAIGTLVTGGLIHSPSGLCFCHCTVSSFRAQTTAHLVLSPLLRPRKAPDMQGAWQLHCVDEGSAGLHLSTLGPCPGLHKMVSGTF